MRQRHKQPLGQGRRGVFARIVYAFRERQIYLRSEGDVQFISLKPWMQVSVLLCVLGIFFGLAFVAVNFTFKDQLLALKERRLYQARLEFEDRIDEMRASIDRLNKKLMLNQDSYLDKVDEVRADYEKLVERHGRLVEFFRQGWMPVKTDGDAARELDGTRQVPGNTVAPSKDSSRKGSLNEWSARQIYAREFRSLADVERPLHDLRAHMAKFEDLQAALLDDVIKTGDKRIDDIAKLYARFGLSGRKIAAESTYNPDAIGGPFLSVTANDIGSKRIAERINSAAANFVMAEKLKFELGKLPLVLPLAKYKRITSGYGLRRDPFRRRMAMHAGIDFKAVYGAPILATAAGVVVKAGREGAYGKLVEIRHDNGFATRYAHMSATKVRRGQRVNRGDVVGRLGNTGRSTGAHLHYETRRHGKSIDPVRFWKARHALQKISQ